MKNLTDKIITDLFTFEEVQCTFKKRYERMAGNLILLFENHFLAPLCISPFKDSIRNGLFGSNWTVCYTVFDIKHNKPVFNGITTETKIMSLVDCVLANDEDMRTTTRTINHCQSYRYKKIEYA